MRAAVEGVAEDEMVGWHHRLSGHESEQTPGDSRGQRSLVCCNPWGHKEQDTATEQQRIIKRLSQKSKHRRDKEKQGVRGEPHLGSKVGTVPAAPYLHSARTGTFQKYFNEVCSRRELSQCPGLPTVSLNPE